MAEAGKAWSYRAGEKGVNRVRVFEDTRRKVIFAEFVVHTPNGSKKKRVLLRNLDREAAKRYAEEMAARFRSGAATPRAEVTLGTLFDIYLRERTPAKGSMKQLHDQRCAEMFLRYFGASREVRTLARREFDRFVLDRRSGSIAPARVTKVRTVGACVIGHDLRWLNAVLNWAAIAGDGHGGALIQRNPFRGFPLPREESPRRPMVSEAQYRKLLRVARRIHPLFELALVVAHETGHRVGSIRLLRWSDIDFRNRRIRWRAENDKIGFEHHTPLTSATSRLLKQWQQDRGGIGESWVFSPGKDDDDALSRHTLIGWWADAERAAGIPHSKGMGFHGLRRKFATEMKEMPLKDLCYAGGWKCPQTVLTCYQQPDDATIQRAFARRGRVRSGRRG